MSDSEIVIGAKSKQTGIFDFWAAKDADYDLKEWKKEMKMHGYDLYEMHVGDMIDIIDSYKELTVRNDA